MNARQKSLIKFAKIIPILLLLCFDFSCQKQVEKGITEEEAKAITDQVLEIWNDGKLDLINDVYAPEIVVHSSSLPEEIKGPEGLKNWVSRTRTAFPDLQMTFDEIIVKADKIVSHWTSTGTNTGTLSMPFGDLPATGKKINVSGLAIDRVENGKVVEEQVVFNVLEMLQQLGFTLAPPQISEEKK